MLDVIIAGGGPAGPNVALVLGRQRRRTAALFDDGKTSNAAAHAVHGFLSRDGVEPAQLRTIALGELRAYDTIEFCIGRASSVRATHDHHSFVVTLEGGTASGRKLLLAVICPTASNLR